MRATKLTIIVLSLFLTAHLNAQIPPTPPNPGGGTNPTPITGIEILLALGGLFGVKKVIDFRKKK
jgi:hypothetical protein